MAPPQERWDLSALFSGMQDPKIEETWTWGQEEAARIEATYRGKIADENIDAEYLLEAIQALERLTQRTDKPVIYANLLFAVEANNHEIGGFLQKQMEASSSLRIKVVFFELELQSLPKATIDRLLADPRLANYRHFIEVAYEHGVHRLSEPEEVIMEELANTGSRAWVRLFEEVTANHVYKYRAPGATEVQEFTEQEVLSLLRNPDRAVRQAAADSFSAGLKELERVLVFIYNNIMQDKKVGDRLRKHPYPEHARHLSNELTREIVDLVVGLCREHYGLVERYYQSKKQLLGLSELTHIDRYAPLFETKEQFSYDRAREIVLNSFGKFSDVLRDRAEEFFDQHWIDAEPRTGKTGGAFCMYCTPDTHPVIMMSYLNKMDDVGTLAHELGHGVHASLSREQSYFNFHGTLPLAELASIFGEMLVFEDLVAKADSRDALILHAEKVEGIFASVFRQAAMFSFEQQAHRKRREEGELSADELGELWHTELQAMFGSSLKLGEQHRGWWSYVGHFFFAPFYVYAYSFGELLTLALYDKARSEGASFATKYVDLLKLAGSQSPKELMATVGVDLSSRDFWMGGFRAIERLIERFEQLQAENKG